jgi:hypothetical protein
MVMQKEHLMLSLIFPRKHQVGDIDIYLELLIEKMFLLCNGIQMYGISRPIPEGYLQCTV